MIINDIKQVDEQTLWKLCKEDAGEDIPEISIMPIPPHWADRDVEEFLSSKGSKVYYAYTNRTVPNKRDPLIKYPIIEYFILKDIN